MKRVVKLSVTAGELVERMPNWLDAAREIVKPLLPLNEVIYPAGVDFIFDGHPVALEEVKGRLKAYGFRVESIERREYTTKEFQAAEFLHLGCGAFVDSVSKRVGEEWIGTLRWDWELLCPHCDFFVEKWDLAALRIRTAPKGYQFAHVDYSGPQVVSALLAEALEQANFSGLALIPVKGQEPSVWYVIQATHILPPMMVPPTRMKRTSRATSQCAPDHAWSNPDSELFYRRKGFQALDFNYTYEVFGETTRAKDGSIVGATGRYLVISNQVYQLLRQLEVCQLVYEPIRFVE